MTMMMNMKMEMMCSAFTSIMYRILLGRRPWCISKELIKHFMYAAMRDLPISKLACNTRLFKAKGNC